MNIAVSYCICVVCNFSGSNSCPTAFNHNIIAKSHFLLMKHVVVPYKTTQILSHNQQKISMSPTPIITYTMNNSSDLSATAPTFVPGTSTPPKKGKNRRGSRGGAGRGGGLKINVSNNFGARKLPTRNGEPKATKLTAAERAAAKAAKEKAAMEKKAKAAKDKQEKQEAAAKAKAERELKKLADMEAKLAAQRAKAAEAAKAINQTITDDVGKNNPASGSTPTPANAVPPMGQKRSTKKVKKTEGENYSPKIEDNTKASPIRRPSGKRVQVNSPALASPPKAAPRQEAPKLYDLSGINSSPEVLSDDEEDGTTEEVLGGKNLFGKDAGADVQQPKAAATRLPFANIAASFASSYAKSGKGIHKEKTGELKSPPEDMGEVQEEGEDSVEDAIDKEHVEFFAKGGEGDLIVESMQQDIDRHNKNMKKWEAKTTGDQSPPNNKMKSQNLPNDANSTKVNKKVYKNEEVVVEDARESDDEFGDMNGLGDTSEDTAFIPDGDTEMEEVIEMFPAADNNNNDKDNDNSIRVGGEPTPTPTGGSVAQSMAQYSNHKTKTAVTPSTAGINVSQPTSIPAAVGTNTSGVKSALSKASYSSVPHGTVVENEHTTQEDMNEVIKVGTVIPGAPGHNWFLTVGFERQDGIDAKDTLLGGGAAVVQMLSSAIPNFRLLAFDRSLPDIISHLVEHGYPDMAMTFFQYFKTKNKRFLNGGNQPGNQAQGQSNAARQGKKYDDDEEYSGKDVLYGTIMVSGDSNIKDVVDNIAWDLQGTGLSLKWKPHQSAESSTQIIIMGVPRAFCYQGVQEQLEHHLKETEKRLISKGKLDLDNYDKPLPQMVISWKQNKKGKNKNQREARLSLNNIPEFANNGCFVLNIEASPDDWQRMAPIWSLFWKSGLCRIVCGRRTKLVQVYQGSVGSSDRITMQRLKRIQVVYTSRTFVVVLPNVETMNKVVEVRMDDRVTNKKPPQKYTSLLRELMRLKVTHEGNEVPAVQAVYPIAAGLQAGSISVLIRTDVPEAQALIAKMEKSIAGWWFGYWLKVCGYTLGCTQSLMESFDIDAAQLAQFSTFDVPTLTVEAEFGDTDNYLEENEAEFGLTGCMGEVEEMGDIQIDLAAAREGIQASLKDRDDLTNASREGPSRRTDFEESCGASTLNEGAQERVAINHIERAKQNIELTKANADLAAKSHDLEQQAEKLRAELELLRSQASNNNNVNQSTSSTSTIPTNHSATQDNPTEKSNTVAWGGYKEMGGSEI